MKINASKIKPNSSILELRGANEFKILEVVEKTQGNHSQLCLRLEILSDKSSVEIEDVIKDYDTYKLECLMSALDLQQDYSDGHVQIDKLKGKTGSARFFAYLNDQDQYALGINGYIK